MNAIKFDEKNRSAEISVHDLAKTMEIGNSNGEMPKGIPIQPGIFLENLIDKVHRITGLQAEYSPIVIREQYCQTNRSKVKNNESLDFSDYIIKRFVTKITLPLVEFAGTLDQMKACIALTYAYTDTTRGIQIAFGENVSVCDNLSAFGKYHFSTFGSDKVSFDDGMQLLDHWFQNLTPIHGFHTDVITQLMDRPVTKDQYLQMIGYLFEGAVANNNGILSGTPMNQTQVAGMVHEGIKLFDGNSVSAWDILNAGTHVLKPHTSDMLHLLDDTTSFNDYMLNHMGIEVNYPEFKKA